MAQLRSSSYSGHPHVVVHFSTMLVCLVDVSQSLSNGTEKILLDLIECPCGKDNVEREGRQSNSSSPNPNGKKERKKRAEAYIYAAGHTHISRSVFFLTHTFQSPPIYVQTLRSKSLSAASLLIYVAYYTLFDTFWTPGRKLIIETCVVWPSCPVECWMRAKRDTHSSCMPQRPVNTSFVRHLLPAILWPRYS